MLVNNLYPNDYINIFSTPTGTAALTSSPRYSHWDPPVIIRVLYGHRTFAVEHRQSLSSCQDPFTTNEYCSSFFRQTFYRTSRAARHVQVVHPPSRTVCTPGNHLKKAQQSAKHFPTGQEEAIYGIQNIVITMG